MKRLVWMLIAPIAILAVLALSYCEPVAIGSAVSASERRPSLLDDAEWSDPASARAFNERFRQGTATSELISWLRANDFDVDQDQRRAQRRLQSMPCNERVVIAWSADEAGDLVSAQAIVTEAGCL